MLGNALVAAVASVVAATAAAVPLQQTAAPPPSQVGAATFVVSGRGWGHGVGMSQYGALGYARRGTTYDQILQHYYPGTQLGPAPIGKVRVLLAENQKAITIASDAPFSLTDGAGFKLPLKEGKYTLGPGLKLKPSPEEPAQVLVSPVTFGRGVLPLELKDRSYRGTIEIAVTGKKLRAINALGLEAYLYGVVPDEMPEDWPLEALKAQAVVARSYALANRRGGDFDLYADVRSQVYGGIGSESFTATAAVDATVGQVLTYNGQVISTPYHSTSGGRTAAASDVWAGGPVPYLVSVKDPYDSLSPYHRWGPFSFDGKSIRQKLKLPKIPLDFTTVKNKSERASSITVTFADATTKSIPAQEVRSALGLRSTWFDVGALALAKPVAPIVYGGKGTLTVVARAVAEVTLEQKSDADWQPLGGLTPTAQPFGVEVKPAVTTEYRLTTGTVATPGVRVLVAPLVRLAPLPAAGSLSGTVRPVLPGAPVVVERQDDTGAWSEVARTAVEDNGTFTALFGLEDGTYRARVPAAKGFAVGTSQPLKVIRT
jgi:stage II sporulation protein D